MTYTLGIDIGTFESKGVLVDHSGNVAAMATAPHEMLVPQPGWAEHRPDDDWWGDFVTITRKLLADTGTDPAEIKAGTLQAWAKDVDYRHLAAAVSNVAGDSPHARKLADRVCRPALRLSSLRPSMLMIRENRLMRSKSWARL